MYDEVMKNGWVRNTNFDDYDATQPIFETPTMSLQDLQALVRLRIQKLLHTPKLCTANVETWFQFRLRCNKKIHLL